MANGQVKVECIQQADVMLVALNRIEQALTIATKTGTPLTQLAVYGSMQKLRRMMDKVRVEISNLTLPGTPS